MIAFFQHVRLIAICSTGLPLGVSEMALAFYGVFVAVGREPSGFATFTVHSPDGLRRSANIVSAIGREPNGTRFVIARANN